MVATAVQEPAAAAQLLKAYTIVDQIIFEMDYTTGCWRKLRRRIRMAADRRQREEDDGAVSANGEDVPAVIVTDPNYELPHSSSTPSSLASATTTTRTVNGSTRSLGQRQRDIPTHVAAGPQPSTLLGPVSGQETIRLHPSPMTYPRNTPGQVNLGQPAPSNEVNRPTGSQATPQSARVGRQTFSGQASAALNSPRRMSSQGSARTTPMTNTNRPTGFDVPPPTAVSLAFPGSTTSNNQGSNFELELLRRQQQRYRRFVDQSRQNQQRQSGPQRRRPNEEDDEDVLSRLARGEQPGFDWIGRRRLWWPWHEDEQQNGPTSASARASAESRRRSSNEGNDGSNSNVPEIRSLAAALSAGFDRNRSRLSGDGIDPYAHHHDDDDDDTDVDLNRIETFHRVKRGSISVGR
jgi:hypothetical protein